MADRQRLPVRRGRRHRDRRVGCGRLRNDPRQGRRPPDRGSAPRRRPGRPVLRASWPTRTWSRRTGNAPASRSPSPRPPSWAWTHQPAELDGYGADHRRHGPPHRRRPHRPMAGPAHRRRRPRHRGRVENLPPARGHDPHRHRPRRALLFPGCRRTARYNDLDHIQAYQPGDQTTQATLMSLCRRHHRFKHSGDWTVTRDDTTNITTWTDKRGRTLPNPTTHPTHHHNRHRSSDRNRARPNEADPGRHPSPGRTPPLTPSPRPAATVLKPRAPEPPVYRELFDCRRVRACGGSTGVVSSARQISPLRQPPLELTRQDHRSNANCSTVGGSRPPRVEQIAAASACGGSRGRRSRWPGRASGR